MTGLVAILGGQEHQPGCEPVDRRLLAESGLSHPTVAVLLAATIPERVEARIAESTAYWRGLGANVRIGFAGRGDQVEQALAALVDPELVVLTGGRPWLLQRRLTTPIVDRLRELREDGVPLAGSSAGAMALCTWRLDVQPYRAPRIRPGLGMLPGAAAPHYGRHAIHHVAGLFASANPDLPILGLNDRTALVGRRTTFDVAGPGGCTVLHRNTRQHHPSGSTVTLAHDPRPSGSSRVEPATLEPIG